MPGYDGTGPRGKGQMTGGGRGYCVAPVSGSGWMPRIGRFFGRGGGRGRRNMYYATGLTGWQRAGYGYSVYPGGADTYHEPTAEQEKEMLKSEAEVLKNGLKEIHDRLDALETNKEKD